MGDLLIALLVGSGPRNIVVPVIALIALAALIAFDGFSWTGFGAIALAAAVLWLVLFVFERVFGAPQYRREDR